MNDLKLDGLTGKTIKEAEVDGFGIRMVFTDGAVFEYDASDGGYSQYELTEATADAQPGQKKGHWIVWGGMDIPENHGRHKCSECGEFAPVRYEKPLIKENLSNFCPNCGADMRGEQDETN